MDTEKYKELYKKISFIVNKIDPGYYNGPEDEYDFQVNGIIKLIEEGEGENYEKFFRLFFGENETVTDEQQDKIKKIIEEIYLFVN